MRLANDRGATSSDNGRLCRLRPSRDRIRPAKVRVTMRMRTRVLHRYSGGAIGVVPGNPRTGGRARGSRGAVVMSGPLARGDRSTGFVKATAPFVGRAQEFASLYGWRREAAAGEPRVVLIEGDAGIGKSRLVHEVQSIAARLGMDVCFGRCYEDLALPYLPFIESLLPQRRLGLRFHQPRAAPCGHRVLVEPLLVDGSGGP